jgi:hypothetical protein
MLFKTAWPMDTELKQLQLRARTIGSVVGKQIGLLASGVGECDLAAGPAFAAEIARDAGFHFLASNLLDKAGKKLFSSHMIVESAGIRVGLFGICGTLSGNIPSQQGIQQEDPLAAARREVEFLRPRAHLVVCLSHMGLQADQDLARNLPGLDLIVGGHSREMTTDPIVLGRTLVVQAYCQGKYVCKLELDAPATWPTTASWVNARYGSPGPGGPAAPRFDCLFAPMDKNVGEDASVTSELKTLAAEVAKLSGAQPPPPAPAVGPVARPAPAPSSSVPATPQSTFVYWGAPLCASCHTEQTAFWKKTVHATAMDVLRKRGKSMDLECIGCHTTGFRKPGGFDTANRMFNFENVQCEACHGPGLEHGKGTLGATARSRATCVGCHTTERSPHFDYDAMLSAMSCPKMQPTSR